MIAADYLTWRNKDLREEDGVLVGSDLSQEWLLPWWWERYSKKNSHPVAFVDFGMSFKIKEWCKERGELIPLRILDDFIEEKDQIAPEVVTHLEDEFGKHFWTCRSVWFKKPFAFLQTPFRRTVWIDLDCEVRGPVKELFGFADPSPGLAMILDPRDTLIDYSYPIYNSGVIPYRHGIPLISDWAKECIEKNRQFRGDQEIFSNMIAKSNIQITELPLKFNWSRTLKEDSKAVILHWHGIYGKYVIRNQITGETLSF